MLKPVAARALAVSWAASPATALKAIPVAAQPSPKARDPTAGNPPAASAAAASNPRTTLAPRLMVSAAASGASRPSLPPPSSSRRPLSSSLAGVPDGEDDHEDGEDGGHKRGVFDQREGADGGGIVDPSEQGHHRGGRVQHRGGLDAARQIRVELGSGQRRRVGDQGKAKDPERKQPAVPPQSEPDQDARSGQGLRHRRPAVRAAPGCRAGRARFRWPRPEPRRRCRRSGAGTGLPASAAGS